MQTNIFLGLLASKVGFPELRGIEFSFSGHSGLPRKPVAHNYNLFWAYFPLLWPKVSHYCRYMSRLPS